MVCGVAGRGAGPEEATSGRHRPRPPGEFGRDWNVPAEVPAQDWSRTLNIFFSITAKVGYEPLWSGAFELMTTHDYLSLFVGSCLRKNRMSPDIDVVASSTFN